MKNEKGNTTMEKLPKLLLDAASRDTSREARAVYACRCCDQSTHEDCQVTKSWPPFNHTDDDFGPEARAKAKLAVSEERGWIVPGARCLFEHSNHNDCKTTTGAVLEITEHLMVKIQSDVARKKDDPKGPIFTTFLPPECIRPLKGEKK